MALTPGANLNIVPAPQKQTLGSNYLDFTASATKGWAQQYLPDLMEQEAEVFGNRTISGFLSQVGAEESMSSDQVIWSEQGRLHLAYVGTTSTVSSKTNFAFDTDIDGNAVSTDHGVRVGDMVLVSDADAEVRAYVSAVDGTTGDLTLLPYDRADLTQNQTGPPAVTGIADAAKYIGPKIGPLTRAAGRGIRDNYAELGLAGGVGLGINALLNEGVLYGDTPEEAAAKAAQKLYNSPEEVEKRRVAAKVLANQAKEQARADALQAKRQEEADRRAYLALALGGAKTMAGQSPYALANIGEGLGTGVASLVELEEAEAARQSATDIAEQKFMNDLYKQSIDQMNKFAELKLKLRGGDDGGRMLEVLRAKLEDEGIEITDLSNPRYIELENETIIEMYPSMAPRGNAIVNGQAFTGV